MQYFITILSLIIINGAIAQFNDSFTDGDFSSNPTWAGDDSVFTVFSSAGNNQLRSNKTIPSSSFYLSTPSTSLTNSQWEFFTKLAFNTSSTNFVDCYLTADQANLKSASLNGYFVRLGGTLDDICLYKKINGIATKIIDGTDGMLNAASSSLKLKITCSSSNLWELFCDQTGVGTDFQSLGTITDSSISSSNYVGFVVTQSTASFFQKHYFDDFYVGPIIYDLTPPELLTATAVSNQTITLLFNEKLDQNSAENTGNYSIQNATSTISINAVTLDPIDKKIVHLTTSQLANGSMYTLTANGIKDLALNIASTQQTTFQYLVNDTVKKGDLIINEFLCDESPSIGLPKVEYIELYNKSTKYFNLNGLKISDGSSEGTIVNKWIFPGEYVILCANSSVDSFSVNVAVGVSNFPSFNNSGDSIILKDTGNLIIDQLLYSSEWYKDETKDDGGYSLELINPNDPCSDGDNWKASTSNNGGTPGAMNAIYDTTIDQIAPNILSVFVSDSNQLTMNFSEGMDTFSLQNVVFNCNPPLTIAQQINPSNKQLILTFNEQLLGSQNYTFTLENAQDCWGNSQLLTQTFVRPESPIQGELIVNELLVDPKTGGSDWIELYNNSNKVIDLFKVQFANYDDSIANFKKVPIHYYLKPAQYAVIGNDSAFVKTTYPAAISGTFIQCATPSYNNDSGTVYLFYDSLLLEKVAYSSKWHFSLLENSDGVALERINPNNSLNDENNWHSAAEAIGFGTPGKINSQTLNQQQQGDFQLSSKTISPDNDGYEDFLLIHYQLLQGGMVGTIKIFDAAGRLIKQLISNELLATSGEFKWDGTRDSGVKATIGNYIILFEAFSLSSGENFTKTKVVIVAGIL